MPKITTTSITVLWEKKAKSDLCHNYHKKPVKSWRNWLIEGLDCYGHICSSTAHLQWSRELQMEHLPPPFSPALWSKSQYNLLQEWIMLMSHCFVNCLPASRAIKPKQNNCKRFLHLCRALAGCGEQYAAADDGKMPVLALKNQLVGWLRSLFCSPTLSCNFHTHWIL